LRVGKARSQPPPQRFDTIKPKEIKFKCLHAVRKFNNSFRHKTKPRSTFQGYIIPFFIKAGQNLTRRENFVIRVLGLLVICAGLSTFAASAQSLSVTTNAIVSEHWRGAFDLLIRPPASISNIERKTGLVEGNYLGTPQGGITLDQLELIRSVSGVEVAAPVSSIGYLLNDTGGIDFGIPQPEPGTVYQAEYELRDASGEIISRETGYVAIPTDLEMNPGNYATYGIQSGFIGPHGEFDGNLGQLPVMWTLVAGIDPAAEAKLTGLDQVIQGGFLPQENTLQQTINTTYGNQKAAKIPVIISEHSFLDDNLIIRVKALRLSESSLWQQIASPQGPSGFEAVWTEIAAQFDGPLAKTVWDQTLKLNRLVEPLSAQKVAVNLGQGMTISSSGYGVATNTNVVLYPYPFDYVQVNPPEKGDDRLTLRLETQQKWGEDVAPKIQSLQPENFRAQPLDVPGDASLFRRLEVFTPPAFVLDVRGSYDFEKLVVPRDPLSYVPLGIYEPPTAILRFDEQGNPVEPSVLTPDLNPASFIPRPPLGLTNLAGAHYLLGREDFIDAIRVRVSGIDRYTPQSVAKVEKVAAEIAERTHLHVDIVAGSSPQKVLVSVPGLGYVEENWTTLGAATTITSGVSTANLILLGTLLLAAGLFITNSAQLSLNSRWEEIGLLKAIGWGKLDIALSLLGELLILGLTGAFLAAMAAWAITLALGMAPDWRILISTSGISPLIYLLGGAWPIQRVIRRPPVANLRFGEVEERQPHALWLVGAMSLAGLALRQLMRRPGRLGLTVSLIATGTALSTLIINFIVNLQSVLRITFLGETVAIEIKSFHLLMVVTTLAMSALVVMENLLLGVMERKREIGLFKAFGWKHTNVFTEVVLEGLIIGLGGGFLGALAGTLAFGLLARTIYLPVGLVAGSVWLGGIILGMLAALFPAWQASRLKPIEVIAYSGIRAPRYELFHLTRRQAIGLGLSLVLFLTAIVFLGGRPEVIQQGLTTGLSGISSAEFPDLGISSENLMNHVVAITKNGARANRNQAEADAASYLANIFRDYGLDVQLEPVPLNVLQIQADAASASQISNTEITTQAMLFHQDELAPGDTITATLAYKSLQDPWPPAETIQDKILLVELPSKDQESPADLAQEILEQYGSRSFRAAFLAQLDDDQKNLISALPRENFNAVFKTGENVIATLPGKAHPDQEIWITTHYDTAPDSPGADAGASGPAALLELARLLSKSRPAITIRFIAFSGTEIGFSGATSFMKAHAQELGKVVVALDLDQLGAWDHLAVATSLDAKDPNGALRPEDRSKLQEEGQFYLRQSWLMYLNLDQDRLGDWITAIKTQKLGLPETPEEYLQLVVGKANHLGIATEEVPFQCQGNQPALLAGGIPTVAICGQGNGLARTSFDEVPTLRRDSLLKATALAYESVQGFLGERK
jgi:cell division protein FtsX